MRSRSQSRLAGWTVLEDRLAPALTIRIDYTYDDPSRGGMGFFADPTRRALVERAARDLAAPITSTPAAITPGGSNTWTATFFHPSTGQQTSIPNLSVAQGEMIVYVGAMAMGSAEAGLGGTGGFQGSGTSSFLTNLRSRGQTGYAAWGGSVSFDTTVPWYTGSATTYASSLTDLYTVAVHEMGHVLGLGTSAEFNQRFNGPYFIGENAVAANGNRPVAMSPDLAHWASGTMSNGQPASLQPEIIPGIRYGFSALDYAALKDIGWQVSTGPTSPPRAASTLTLQSSPAAPTAFAAYTLTAAVARSGGGSFGGTVSFSVAGFSVGTVPVGADGRATISVPGTGAGAYSVTASYSGDATTLSSSGSMTLNVLPSTSSGTPLTPDQVVDVAGLPGGYSQLFRFNSTGGLTVAAGTFKPFADFYGSIRSATADLNGDGTPDIAYVTGAGGGSRVRFVNGATGADLASSLSVFEPSYTGGLFVAAADFDGDGRDEIVVSPDRGGGGRVTVLKVEGGRATVSANFFGIEDQSFRGGARIAAGDVNGDGRPDLIVGAGFGGGPRVAIFDGQAVAGATSTPRKLVGDFYAFGGSDAQSLRNGVYISAGDVNGDGRADLVFAAGPGGGPRVTVASGASLLQNAAAALASPIANFFAFDESLRGGVRAAVKDADRDGKMDLVIGSGEGDRARVKVYKGSNLVTPVIDVDVFGAQMLADGVYVG
jgi:hypothetical protein